MVAACGLVAGCSGPGGPANGEPKSGVASAIGPPPTFTLPARTTGVSLSVKPARQPITGGNDALWGMDQQLGPAYHVTITREVPGVTVHFKVDPAKVAKLIKADGGSAKDLFVELYEPYLGLWIPLRSTYSAASSVVSAVTPHLSTVSLGWIVTQAAQAAFPGILITPATALAAKFAKSFASEMEEALSPRQQHDACGQEADKDWSVSTQVQHLYGCVSTRSGNHLLMEDRLLVPMDVAQPPGPARASLELEAAYHDSFPQFLDRGLVWTKDQTLLPARSAAASR